MKSLDQEFNGLMERNVVIDGETVLYRYARHIVEDGVHPPTKIEVTLLYRTARNANTCPAGGPIVILSQDLEDLRISRLHSEGRST